VASRKQKSAPSRKPENVVAAARGKPAQRSTSRSITGKVVWDNVKSLLGIIAIFLFVRTFLIEAYRIPSPSMVPTMLVGDWLFVNKLVYGPHVPFTDMNLPGYSDPKRGDLAVFRSPTQTDQPWDPNPTVVKRIVGTPGDTLFMRDDLLHVNGIAQRQGYEAANNPVGDGNAYDPLFEWQHEHAIAGSRFGAPPARPTVSNWGPLVVPGDHYFMMGDNRHASKDSRYWGLVPRGNLRGRPLFVYFSFRAGGESDRAFPAITDIRWGRIGHRYR
jgi:signal peptidase I